MITTDRMSAVEAVSQSLDSEWFATFGLPTPMKATNSDDWTPGFHDENLNHQQPVLRHYRRGTIAQTHQSCSETSSCRVIFDGTLYNRNEFVKEFGSAELDPCDASLLQVAYLRLGEALFNMLRGNFCILIWDARTDALLCARDQLGGHPLFYADAGPRVLLSSSMDSLIHQSPALAEVSRIGIADNLIWRYPDARETMYKGIRRVLPGQLLKLRSDGAHRSVTQYWEPAPLGDQVDWIGVDGLEQFYPLLEQAIDRRLSAGRAGIYLSGGIDSVSVAAVTADRSRDNGIPDPYALSLIFPESESDEEPIQRGVATQLGLPHYITPILDTVPLDGLFSTPIQISKSLSAPLQNIWLPSYAHLAMVGRENGCRLIFSGSGGDEWLSITPSLSADLIRRRDVAGLIRLGSMLHRSYRAPLKAVIRNVAWQYGGRLVLEERARHSLPKAVVERYKHHRLSRFTPSWIAPDPVLKKNLLDRAVSTTMKRQPVDSFYLFELRTALNHPLVMMDMEEKYQVGNRLGLSIMGPYWDVDLVDFLIRLSPEILQQDGLSKAPARRLATTRFPDLGFDRQKKVQATSFTMAEIARSGIAAWDVTRGIPRLSELGIVDPAVLNRESAQHILQSGGGAIHPMQLFEMLNVEAWLQSHGN